MEVWNLLTCILQPVWLYLSDMDHMVGNAFFLQLVLNPFYEPIDNV